MVVVDTRGRLTAAGGVARRRTMRCEQASKREQAGNRSSNSNEQDERARYARWAACDRPLSAVTAVGVLHPLALPAGDRRLLVAGVVTGSGVCECVCE